MLLEALKEELRDKPKKNQSKKQLRSEQDSAWKMILDPYLKQFTEFFYSNIAKKIDWAYGYTALDKELQGISFDANDGKRFVDKLFEVKSLKGTKQTLLVHIEIQGKKEEEFPLRLFQYYYRLFERCKKPIITLAILTDNHKTWHPNSYETEVLDFPVLSFNFQSHKLLNYQNKKQALYESDNPFAGIVLAHLAFIETKNNPDARFKMKFSLTRRLYEKGYTRDYVINFFTMIDWILVMPKELSLEFKAKIHELEEEKKVRYITSIEQFGREEGLEQGRRENSFLVAQRMLARGYEHNAIRDLLGLSPQDFLSLETQYPLDIATET